MRSVLAQHQPAGVRHDLSRFTQQCVCLTQHLRKKRRAGVDRGPQPSCVVLRLELVCERGDDFLRVDAPAQRRVEQPERQRPARSILNRLTVAVHVIGHAPTLVVIAHEWNRAGIGSKWGAGKRQPTHRAIERGA